MLSETDLNSLREGGQRLVAIFQALAQLVRPGANLLELEARANELARAAGGQPSFKGYQGYPAALCLSPNQVIVHGIPKDYILKEGDILAIDMGLLYQGWHTDAALTLPVGKVSPEVEHLLATTYQALLDGTAAAQAGRHVGDISRAIEQTLRGGNLTIFRSLVGHGVGRELHMEPMIPNYSSGDPGPELKPGLILALEPIAGLGREASEELPDGWTIVTADGRPAAHFEHTILVTPAGPEVLTPLESVIAGPKTP